MGHNINPIPLIIIVPHNKTRAVNWWYLQGMCLKCFLNPKFISVGKFENVTCVPYVPHTTNENPKYKQWKIELLRLDGHRAENPEPHLFVFLFTRQLIPFHAASCTIPPPPPHVPTVGSPSGTSGKFWDNKEQQLEWSCPNWYLWKWCFTYLPQKRNGLPCLTSRKKLSGLRFYSQIRVWCTIVIKLSQSSTHLLVTPPYPLRILVPIHSIPLNIILDIILVDFGSIWMILLKSFLIPDLLSSHCGRQFFHTSISTASNPHPWPYLYQVVVSKCLFSIFSISVMPQSDQHPLFFYLTHPSTWVPVVLQHLRPPIYWPHLLVLLCLYPLCAEFLSFLV